MSDYIKYWRLYLSGAIALALTAILPKSALASATQELLAFFGLIMAGVLPTMVLAASSLRAGALSKKKIQRFHEALCIQMKVWAGLFLMSLLASLVVIFAKFSNWSILIVLNSSTWGSSILPETIDVVYLFNFVILFCLALLALRGLAIGTGLSSLLSLSAEIAFSEAEERDQIRLFRMQSELRDIQDSARRDGYVDLPNNPL